MVYWVTGCFYASIRHNVIEAAANVFNEDELTVIPAGTAPQSAVTGSKNTPSHVIHMPQFPRQHEAIFYKDCSSRDWWAEELPTEKLILFTLSIFVYSFIFALIDLFFYITVLKNVLILWGGFFLV